MLEEVVGRERKPGLAPGCELPRFWKRCALEPVDGVEGVWLGEKWDSGLIADGPGVDIMLVGVAMLRPPHLGHLRFSASGLDKAGELVMLVLRPLRRGWYL